VIHLVCICVDGVFICLFFHFRISIIFINLSNKLVKINLKSKEINLNNKRFEHNIRSILMSCPSGISTVVYKSYDLKYIEAHYINCNG
jgi:hypothetical protein